MTLNEFYRRQLASWKLAAGNYRALIGVETRTLVPAGAEDGMAFTLQHNPARVRSTGANVAPAALAARPCFLCAANRPADQMVLHPADLLPPSGGDETAGNGLSEEYEILLNPFPIFPYHFTIPARNHTHQVICADGCRRFGDMLLLAEAMEGMALFYNGARCGASAPDHFHFQAIPVGAVTLLSTLRPVPFFTLGHESDNRGEMVEWFRRAVDQVAALPVPVDHTDDEAEPRMNVWCAFSGGVWKALIIPRRAHRPDFYGEGDGKFLVSPASIDLAGTIVLPSKADFVSFTSANLASLLAQTTYPDLSSL